MSHLPFTLGAYFFNSISALVDKFLISGTIRNPLIYVFYFSIFSLIALLLLPFTHIPAWHVLLLASSSTLLWTTGAYFMFWALKHGQVSRVIPVIGTLNPLFLLFFALFDHSIGINETWAIVILVLGLVALTLPDWRGRITKQELIFEVLSSIFFAVSYVILRQAYLQDDFLTVFAWSRVVLIPVGLLLVTVPLTRKIVLAKDSAAFNLFSKMGVVFLLGQAAGGAAELLLTFSVSLANPALVNSLQGSQYVFLYIFSLSLSKKFPKIYKERLTIINSIGKLVGILLIAMGLYILAFGKSAGAPTLGVTFSPRYAQELGLNDKLTFGWMLVDLKIKNLRLPIYWDEVEKAPGRYDFSGVDYYLDRARLHNLNVIVGLGFKQPRWPECFEPDFVKNYSITAKNEAILKLVRAEVEHFKESGQIVAWQVENEPYLFFGLCQKTDFEDADQLLNAEVAIVKSLDSRPVLITDSGELTSWVDGMRHSDWFGISVYRTVWNPVFGIVDYPLPPIFYDTKDLLASKLGGKVPGRKIISELQAEPWAPTGRPLNQISAEAQMKIFPLNQLQENVNFAKQTHFNSIYLWGVEWWYYMASIGHPEYLQQARLLFK